MKLYEMNWDCKYCSSKKLLGKTHRFCPSCGAAQNPDKRYYPPDNEKVAVEDHEFVGADRHCPACRAAMAAKAQFCTQCGSPMDAAKEVGSIDKEETAAIPDSKSGKRKYIFAGAGICILAVVLVAVFYKKTIELTVTNQTWIRTIDIQKYETVSKSDWCDATPLDARIYSRKSEVKSYKNVENGQECKTVKKDMRDGTYKEEEECRTIYKEVPEYDDKCFYKIDEWVKTGEVKAEGSIADNIQWPKSDVSGGNCLGCEREGKRKEKYVLHLQSEKDTFECTYSKENIWRSFLSGKSYIGEKRVLTSGLVCDSLRLK